MKQPRSLISLVPASCFVLLQIYFFYPKSFYFTLILSLSVILFSVFTISKNAKDESQKWYNFVILPILFTSSATIYTVLLSSKWLLQFIIIIIVLFLYFYFKNIYYYLVSPRFYRSSSLENLASYGNFLIMFFIFSSFFGFQSLLGTKTWVLALASAPIIWLIVYQVMFANGITLKSGLIFGFLNTLILIELFWAASFLPLSHNSIGLIMAICYYMLIGIVRFYLKGKTGEKKIKFYLLVGIISILAIILSSKWI